MQGSLLPPPRNLASGRCRLFQAQLFGVEFQISPVKDLAGPIAEMVSEPCTL